MNLGKGLKMPHYVVLLVLVLFIIAVVDGQNYSLQQTIDQRLEKEQSYKNVAPAILKRKRRYLEFPEGSSFQLVYDLIVGVVDYTNYLILGVTVALAWELPSKPPSEILSDLTERLKDGTLGTSRNDTVNNIKYVDTKQTPNRGTYAHLKPIFTPPMHIQYYTNKATDGLYRFQDQQFAEKSSAQRNAWHRKGSNYYNYYKALHPLTNWTSHTNTPYGPIRGNLSPKPHLTQAADTFVRSTKFPWWKLQSRSNNYRRRERPIPGTRRFDQNVKSLFRSSLNSTRSYEIKSRPEHRIFPIFGKRSIADLQINAASHDQGRSLPKSEAYLKLENIHIRHHRRTRHELYERIETYLDGRGSNGHHCVLKALCETGQKDEQQRPQSFVGEIMRAIFTLPESTEDNNERLRYGRKRKRYDAAGALVGDCALRYRLCKQSLWSSHFVI